jgi:[ribosomal protein S18]-alanine N-acetyltransferase
LKGFLCRARDHHVNAVYLDVRDSNSRARQFYRSHGFEEIGKRRRFYQSPEEDGILLICRLDGGFSSPGRKCA